MSVISIENYRIVKKNANLKLNATEISIVNGISTKFESGKLNAIMGPNGSGKTTLLKEFYGITETGTKTSGSILLDGMPRNPDEWFDSVSFVEQFPYFRIGITVQAILETVLDMRNSKHGSTWKLDDFKDLISDLHLEKLLRSKGDILSGGEKQRVAIACGIIFDRQIIMLDEPTSDLDSHLALNLMLYLKELAVNKSKMVIFTIHQPSDQIFKLFDNLLFIDGGCSLYSGPADQLDSFLASQKIVKPEDWVVTDFLFEVFYDRSAYDVIESQRQNITVFVNKAKKDAMDAVKSSVPVLSNRKYMMLKTTKREVFGVLRRGLSVFYDSMWGYALILAPILVILSFRLVPSIIFKCFDSMIDSDDASQASIPKDIQAALKEYRLGFCIVISSLSLEHFFGYYFTISPRTVVSIIVKDFYHNYYSPLAFILGEIVKISVLYSIVTVSVVIGMATARMWELASITNMIITVIRCPIFVSFGIFMFVFPILITYKSWITITFKIFFGFLISFLSTGLSHEIARKGSFVPRSLVTPVTILVTIIETVVPFSWIYVPVQKTMADDCLKKVNQGLQNMKNNGLDTTAVEKTIERRIWEIKNFLPGLIGLKFTSVMSIAIVTILAVIFTISVSIWMFLLKFSCEISF